MRAYLDLLAIPGVKRLILSASPGRLAYSMINLATFFFVQHTTGSITVAGLATGAETVASSLTAGIRGQAIDKYGQTRPLSIFVPGWVTLLIILSMQHTTAGILIVSALVGLSSPPINLSARPLWRAAVGAENLRTAYAIDTTIMNTTTVVGPVVATAIALNLGAPTALWVTASLMCIGGIAMITMPLSRKWLPEPTTSQVRDLLRNRPFQLLAIEGMIFGIGWGVLEIAIPATATLNHTPHLAAPMLATLSAASIVGGLLIGGRKSDITPLRGFKVASAFVAVTSLPLAFTHPGLTMGICLGTVGLSIGFAMVYHWEVVEAVRPAGSATSAQAWLWTMEGSMLAAGAAIGGYVVEHISPTAALAGVTLSLLASSGFIWFFAAPRLTGADKQLSDIQKVDALADLESDIPKSM